MIYIDSISVYAACRSRIFRLSSKNGQSRFQDYPFILLIMQFFLTYSDFHHLSWWQVHDSDCCLSNQFFWLVILVNNLRFPGMYTDLKRTHPLFKVWISSVSLNLRYFYKCVNKIVCNNTHVCDYYTIYLIFSNLIHNLIPSLFYLCLFCKKFFCIFLNISYLFCSQIHKIAVIHRAIRILYIHHLSIFLSSCAFVSVTSFPSLPSFLLYFISYWNIT